MHYTTTHTHTHRHPHSAHLPPPSPPPPLPPASTGVPPLCLTHCHRHLYADACHISDPPTPVLDIIRVIGYIYSSMYLMYMFFYICVNIIPIETRWDCRTRKRHPSYKHSFIIVITRINNRYSYTYKSTSTPINTRC